MIALAGDVPYGTASGVYRARPATVFYFPAGEPHQVGYSRCGPAFRHLWLGVLQDHFTLWLCARQRGGEPRFVKIPYVGHEAETGIDFDRHLFALCRAEKEADALLRRSRLLWAIAALIFAAVEKSSGLRTAETGADFQRRVIAAAQKHVQETAGKGVSLKTLARFAGYSKFHFLRLFKKYTGQTLKEYIAICRWRRAQDLLAAGKRQVEIAAALGFSGPQAYCRWRRKFARTLLPARSRLASTRD
ncbi:MAG: helix-turn-helix transcriptional regulator [Planctomycetota bacterium]|nr:helix-turn-helix transcriptional regulator [Planctomycetota bacterium]